MEVEDQPEKYSRGNLTTTNELVKISTQKMVRCENLSLKWILIKSCFQSTTYLRITYTAYQVAA